MQHFPATSHLLARKLNILVVMTSTFLIKGSTVDRLFIPPLNAPGTVTFTFLARHARPTRSLLNFTPTQTCATFALMLGALAGTTRSFQLLVDDLTIRTDDGIGQLNVRVINAVPLLVELCSTKRSRVDTSI